MFKKVLSVLFVAAIMACSALAALTACGHEHEMEFVERHAPTCASSGMAAHWKCTSCGKLFADERGKEEVTSEDLYIAATGKHDYDYILHKCLICRSMYPGYTQIENIIYHDEEENKCVVVRYSPENSVRTIDIKMNVNGKSVIGIDKKVFINADISSVVIPDSVKTIGESAFQSSSMESLTLSKTLQELGADAFAYCKLLAGTIYLPGSIISFGTGAFYSCYSLKEVVIENGITELPDFTFSNCTSLTSVTIPASVKSFGKSVFENCSSLTSVYYDGTIAQWESINKGFWWSYKVNENCVVYCTDGQI